MSFGLGTLLTTSMLCMHFHTSLLVCVRLFISPHGHSWTIFQLPLWYAFKPDISMVMTEVKVYTMFQQLQCFVSIALFPCSFLWSLSLPLPLRRKHCVFFCLLFFHHSSAAFPFLLTYLGKVEQPQEVDRQTPLFLIHLLRLTQ